MWGFNPESYEVNHPNGTSQDLLNVGLTKYLLSHRGDLISSMSCIYRFGVCIPGGYNGRGDLVLCEGNFIISRMWDLLGGRLFHTHLSIWSSTKGY